MSATSSTVEPSLTHRDARADERAHHAVAERVGLHVRDEHSLGIAPPVELEQRADRRRLFARLAVGREVVQSDERSSRGIHRPLVERRAHGGGAVPLERVVPRGRRRGRSSAATPPRTARRTPRARAACGAPRRRSRRRPLRGRGRRAARRPRQPGRPRAPGAQNSSGLGGRAAASLPAGTGLEGGVCTRPPRARSGMQPALLLVVEIDVGDLPGGVDAGIGAAGDDESGLVRRGCVRAPLERALHGAQPGLQRPAAKVRPVVGDVEPDAHRPSLVRAVPRPPGRRPRARSVPLGDQPRLRSAARRRPRPARRPRRGIRARRPRSRARRAGSASPALRATPR